MLKLGKIHIEAKVAITDISDECLLDADILMGLPEGPVDILLSEHKLLWNGISVPCVQIGTADTCNVLNVEKRVIPPLTEVILDAKLDGLPCYKEVLVEPSPRLAEKKNVLLGASLVSVKDDRKVQRRLINPWHTEATTFPGQLLGTTDAIEIDILDVANSEDSTE